MHDVVVTAAPSAMQASGVLGFAKVIIGELLVDGLVVRRSAAGAEYVSWPTREGRDGRRHLVVIPINPGLKSAVEGAVLGAWGQR